MGGGARSDSGGASWSDKASEDDIDTVDFFRASDNIEERADAPHVELPLFPLQVVLNPGCQIPLYIFELRYRLLFNRIHDGDESRFGVVLYDKEADALARVGCSAELLRFEALPDGRIMTRNVGRERFRIVSILEEKPYMRAIVEFVNDEAPADDCAQCAKQVWAALLDVLSLSNKLYEKVVDLSPEIKRLAPNEAQGGAEVEDFSFAVSQILDMPLREQQLLLQMRDTSRRLKRQSKMLNSARSYLAAQVTIKNAGLGEW